MSTGFEHTEWMSEEHRMFENAVSKFYADTITPNSEKWYKEGQIDRDFWNKAGEAGILGASISEEYGGSGAPRSFDAVSIYQYGRTGDSSWGFSIQNYVMHYLAIYGTDEQKEKWLPGLSSGDLVAALAMTEPGTGSDVQAIKTNAVADGNQYRINGSKTFITNGQQANLICLACKTDKGAGHKGVSLIMVETDDLEGFRRGQPLQKIGMKGNDTSELFFDDCKVPRFNLLGTEEGKGFYQLMEQLPWERLSIGVIALGAIDFAIEQTVAYTQDRKAFGKRIIDFQNTRFKLAEAKTKAEVLRSFIADCVARLDAGTLTASDASMAKWWGTQVQNEVVDECLQLFGGYGFMSEYPIGRLYCDSRVQKIYGGTNEVMKELIARTLDT